MPQTRTSEIPAFTWSSKVPSDDTARETRQSAQRLSKAPACAPHSSFPLVRAHHPGQREYRPQRAASLQRTAPGKPRTAPRPTSHNTTEQQVLAKPYGVSTPPSYKLTVRALIALSVSISFLLVGTHADATAVTSKRPNIHECQEARSQHLDPSMSAWSAFTILARRRAGDPTVDLRRLFSEMKERGSPPADPSFGV